MAPSSQSIPGYLSYKIFNRFAIVDDIILWFKFVYFSLSFFCHQHNISINNARNQNCVIFHCWNERTNERTNKTKRIDDTTNLKPDRFLLITPKMETNYIYVTLIIISISVSVVSSLNGLLKFIQSGLSFFPEFLFLF